MLFELARGRLEQARIPAPVRGFRLVAEELPPFVPAGRELFDERPRRPCRGRHCANACARAWAMTRCTASRLRR